MTKEKKKFLKILKKSFKLAPELRITQTLYNLGLNELAVIPHAETNANYFKDNYNQSDETTIKKVKEGWKRLFKNTFKGIQTKEATVNEARKEEDRKVEAAQPEAV